MVAIPEEGRISDEDYAERLRGAKHRTAEMKRDYRDQREDAEAKAKAEKWLKNRRKKHEAIMQNVEDASVRPLSRRHRRAFAKQMNVFKTPTGWQRFNASYREKFGVNAPLTKDQRDELEKLKKEPKPVVESNLKQVLQKARSAGKTASIKHGLDPIPKEEK